jgi:hypothetical protein
MLGLLVARAGQKDSLVWWDDEALTEAGSFALAKIFLRGPAQAAQRLAVQSAMGRHKGLLLAAGVKQATTLFDLAEPYIRNGPPLPNLVSGPIATPEEFRDQLLTLAPGAGTIRLPSPGVTGLLDLSPLFKRQAKTAVETADILAAGYLLGKMREPIFPFIRDVEERHR